MDSTPRWIRDQLTDRLLIRFGSDRVGHVDQAATQVGLGVSRRTLRRWLHGDPNAVVGMTAANRARVHQMLLPSARAMRQEQLDAEYARQAVQGLRRRRRRGIQPAWRQQRWLEPHLVGIIEHPDPLLRQVAVARTDGRINQLKRRGELLDFLEVPTRFDATLLVTAVLNEVNPWRVVAGKTVVGQGNTVSWSGEAPAVDLAAIAFTQDLRTGRAS